MSVNTYTKFVNKVKVFIYKTMTCRPMHFGLQRYMQMEDIQKKKTKKKPQSNTVLDTKT